MRCGLLLEALHPRPWSPAGDRRRLREALDLAVLADEQGVHRAWVPERMFQEELQHAGPPEVLLSAIAARTRRIGLGLGPLLAHPNVQHPARLAASVAALDALSGGRVSVAFAEPSAAIELQPLGIARADAARELERTVERTARLLVESPFTGEDGEGGLPPRQLVPRPHQRPHPPLWRACDRPADVRTAAEAGLGALIRFPVEPDEAAEWVEEHRRLQASERCVPLGATVGAGVAITLPFHLARDPRTALEEGLDATHLHRLLVLHHERFGAHRPGRTEVAAELRRRRAAVGLDPAPVLAAADEPLAVRVGGSVRGAVGDPEGVLDLLLRYRDAGVEEAILVPPLGAIDREVLRASVALLGSAVLPRLDDDEDDDDLVEAGDAGSRAALARRRRSPDERPVVVLAREDGPGPDAAVAAAAARNGTHDPARSGAPVPTAVAVEGATNGGGPNGATGGGGVGTALGAIGGGPGASSRNGAGDGRRIGPALARRSGQALDRVLEHGPPDLVRRTVASDPVLRVVLTGMARGLREAARSGTFRGELQLDVVEADGSVAAWTVEAHPRRSRARRGSARDAALVVRIDRPDVVRLAAGRLDAGAALLAGRLDLEGDLELAVRLGEVLRGA